MYKCILNFNDNMFALHFSYVIICPDTCLPTHRTLRFKMFTCHVNISEIIFDRIVNTASLSSKQYPSVNNPIACLGDSTKDIVKHNGLSLFSDVSHELDCSEIQIL